MHSSQGAFYIFSEDKADARSHRGYIHSTLGLAWGPLRLNIQHVIRERQHKAPRKTKGRSRGGDKSRGAAKSPASVKFIALQPSLLDALWFAHDYNNPGHAS